MMIGCMIWYFSVLSFSWKTSFHYRSSLPLSLFMDFNIIHFFFSFFFFCTFFDERRTGSGFDVGRERERAKSFDFCSFFAQKFGFLRYPLNEFCLNPNGSRKICKYLTVRLMATRNRSK